MWRKAIGEAVAGNRMPLVSYRMAHPDAALSDADRAILREWAETPVLARR